MEWRELFHRATVVAATVVAAAVVAYEFIYRENVVPSVTRNRPRKYIDARCYKLTTRIIIVLNSARMAGGKSDISRGRAGGSAESLKAAA